MVFRGKPCGCWDCNSEGTGEMFLLTRMRHQALKKQAKHWHGNSIQEMEFLERGQVLCFLLRPLTFPVELQKQWVRNKSDFIRLKKRLILLSRTNNLWTRRCSLIFHHLQGSRWFFHSFVVFSLHWGKISCLIHIFQLGGSTTKHCWSLSKNVYCMCGWWISPMYLISSEKL